MEEFKARLNKILDRKITVETINSYMDRAVDELVDLTDAVVTEYRAKNPDATLSGKELEDVAYEQNNLPNIGEFLSVAERKIDQLNTVDAYITEHIKTKAEIITPPDAWEGLVQTGKGYEKPDIKNRVKSLLYILSEHGVDLSQINAVDGIVTDSMIRELSYVSIAIPELNRLALVCDEEGNASYIFDLEKLREQNVSITEVDAMTKEMRKSFIEKYPGIGVRFAYSANWMERAEEFLFEPLAETEAKEPTGKNHERVHSNIEGLPKASKKELDPWRGFWTDPETGKHWGNIANMVARTDINRVVLDRICEQGTFEKKDIAGVSNRAVVAYCFEDMMADPEVERYTQALETETEGEWRGFHIDEEGNHWGNQDLLAGKLGFSRSVLKDMIRDGKLVKKIARNELKRVVEVYSYEAILADPDIKNLMQSSPVEKSGEWKGFYIDKDGKHWAGLTNLIDKLGIGRDFLEHLAIGEDAVLETQKIKTVAGMSTDAYCYEEVIKQPSIEKYLSTPAVEKTGEWKGFYTDEEGRHWAIPFVVAGKVKLTPAVVERYATDGNLANKMVRDLVGGVKPGICYEDLMRNEDFLRFFNAPHAEKSGEWQRFYVDTYGRHWGTVSTLANKLEMSRETILKIVENNETFKPILIRDASGRDNEGAYCYETLLNEKRIQDILAAPKVEATGEWKGFYIDKDGKHWANLHTLVEKLDISYNVLDRFIREDERSISLRGASGRYGEHGYCYEYMIARPDIKKFLDTPAVEKEGEWKGYYIDKDGRYWGSVRTLALRNKKGDRAINTLAREHNLKSMEIRVSNGFSDAYTVEDIDRVLSEK